MIFDCNQYYARQSCGVLRAVSDVQEVERDREQSSESSGRRPGL